MKSKFFFLVAGIAVAIFFNHQAHADHGFDFEKMEKEEKQRVAKLRDNKESYKPLSYKVYLVDLSEAGIENNLSSEHQDLFQRKLANSKAASKAVEMFNTSMKNKNKALLQAIADLNDASQQQSFVEITPGVSWANGKTALVLSSKIYLPKVSRTIDQALPEICLVELDKDTPTFNEAYFVDNCGDFSKAIPAQLTKIQKSVDALVDATVSKIREVANNERLARVNIATINDINKNAGANYSAVANKGVGVALQTDTSKDKTAKATDVTAHARINPAVKISVSK